MSIECTNIKYKIWLKYVAKIAITAYFCVFLLLLYHHNSQLGWVAKYKKKVVKIPITPQLHVVCILLLLLLCYNWAANWVLASWTPLLSHCQWLDVWWKEGIKVSPIPTAPVINAQNFPIPLVPYPQLYSFLFPCRGRGLTIMFWFANFSTKVWSTRLQFLTLSFAAFDRSGHEIVVFYGLD